MPDEIRVGPPPRKPEDAVALGRKLGAQIAADEVKPYTRWTLDEDCLHIEASLPNSAKGALAALRRLGQQARAGLADSERLDRIIAVLRDGTFGTGHNTLIVAVQRAHDEREGRTPAPTLKNAPPGCTYPACPVGKCDHWTCAAEESPTPAPTCTRFCEQCGDCLDCYAEYPCVRGGDHGSRTAPIKDGAR